jgi:hypothetical protein
MSMVRRWRSVAAFRDSIGTVGRSDWQPGEVKPVDSSTHCELSSLVRA